MDLQYGVAVANKFALFSDEDVDPLEILRQKEEEPKTSKSDKKKASKATKKPAGVATSESKPKQEPPVKREEKTSQPRQNERGGGRGSRGRELRENDGSRPPRRQGPREFREGSKGDENVPPEFRERNDNFSRRDRGERGDFRGERGDFRGERGEFRGEPRGDRGEGGFERGRGRGRGGGRGRGRGGPRPEGGRGGFGGGFGGGPQGDRRREYDRHSGNDRTGVKSIDKRDGSGAHNWGSYRDDVDEEPNTSTSPADVSGEWPSSAPTEPAPETADLNESGENAASPPKEEEPKEMTLDEWKALQDQKRVKASFNIRKAGEGVDSNQWKKGIAYKKKSTAEESEEEDEEEEEEEDEDRHVHRKQLVDIRITFADTPRRGGRGGRGSRGGRGGPRGGRGGFSGPDRGDRGDRPTRGGPRESAPRMDDETDFPRLVKSEA